MLMVMVLQVYATKEQRDEFVDRWLIEQAGADILSRLVCATAGIRGRSVHIGAASPSGHRATPSTVTAKQPSDESYRSVARGWAFFSRFFR